MKNRITPIFRSRKPENWSDSWEKGVVGRYAIALSIIKCDLTIFCLCMNVRWQQEKKNLVVKNKDRLIAKKVWLV